MDDFDYILDRLQATTPEIWGRYHHNIEGYDDFVQRASQCLSKTVDEVKEIKYIPLVRWQRTTPLSDNIDFFCSVERLGGRITITVGHGSDEAGYWRSTRRWILTAIDGIH